MFNKEKIPGKFIIPLISAAAVVRDEKKLRLFIKHALKKKNNHSKVYEALLQTYLFAGFPIALISLKIFSEFYPGNNSKLESLSQKEIKKRGRITCKKIYGEKYDKLIENVNLFSPELGEWLVTEGYGKVISRKQLSLKERELVNVAVLTVLKFDDQLYSHINGAYRVGVNISSIEDLIKCLRILGKKGNAEFGLTVFHKFILQKNSILNRNSGVRK